MLGNALQSAGWKVPTMIGGRMDNRSSTGITVVWHSDPLTPIFWPNPERDAKAAAALVDALRSEDFSLEDASFAHQMMTTFTIFNGSSYPLPEITIMIGGK
jgi:hypothetical protein